MAYMRKSRRGNSVYAYLVESHRDGDDVRQKTLEYLGKVVIEGGKEIIIPPKHRRRIKKVSKRAVELLNPLFTQLRIDLKTSLGDSRGEKFYLIGLIQFLNPSPLKYVEWTADEYDIDCTLDSSTVSKLFRNIDEGEIHNFFKFLRGNRDTIVFDVTSLSYYGESLNTAEFGYNRDGEHLPQVNLSLAVTTGHLPSYFRIINGSIPDVSTIKHTVAELKSLGYKNIHLVLDRGFYSEDNIKEISDYRFTAALPKRLNLFNDIVMNNMDIEHVGNFVIHKDEKIMVREIMRDNIKYVLVFNPKLRYEQQETFMDKLAKIEKNAMRMLGKKSIYEIKAMMGEYEEYYEIKNGRVLRKKELIQQTADLMGRYILFTNQTSSSWKDVLDIYRAKDVAEKAFSILKNSGFLTPIRVWSDETLLGKVFASFIFYYIYSCVMTRTDFTYEEVKRLFAAMQSVQYENGEKSNVELSKKQKKLLTQLGIPV